MRRSAKPSTPATARSARTSAAEQIYVAPGDYDFTDNPSLLERLRADIYGYYAEGPHLLLVH